ncbi:hypothetical protein [Pseudomonas abieticivorans]|uniref:hypothetical protein n=1 Tax=Pseudomonas abieticivorans TaxID=2931382 RepID=UPI0020BF4B53|nr:hypothetical protein [Pseudomonas sp. PIA16]
MSLFKLAMKSQFFITVIILLIVSQSAVADECDAVLKQASVNYIQKYDIEDQKSFAYHLMCNQADTRKSGSSSFGVQAVVEEIPIGINWGASEQSSQVTKWCEENRSYASRTAFSARIERTIFSPAVETWGSCMAAKNKDLRITVESLSMEHVAVTMKNLTERAIFQGVVINSANKDSVSCSGAFGDKIYQRVDSKTVIKFNGGQSISLDCTRKPVSNKLIAASDKYYNQATINFRNTLSPFHYAFPEFNPPVKPVTSDEPEKTIKILDGTLYKSIAHWAGEHKHQDFLCPQQAENMEELIISTRSVNIGKNRGQCLGVATNGSFCDSANESCTEVYVEKGCLVSKNWLAWYKDRLKEQKLNYTMDSVCYGKHL